MFSIRDMPVTPIGSCSGTANIGSRETLLPCSAGAVDNVQQSAVFLFRNSKFSLHKARRLRLAAEDRDGATPFLSYEFSARQATGHNCQRHFSPQRPEGSPGANLRRRGFSHNTAFDGALSWQGIRT